MSPPSFEQRPVFTSSLDRLPVETIIEILQHLDIRSVYSISKTSKRLRGIVASNWTTILRPVIDREMAPIGPFMHVLNVCYSKMATPPARLDFVFDNEEMPSSEEDEFTSDDEEESASDDGGESIDGDDGSLEGSVDGDDSGQDDDPGNIDDAVAILADRPGTDASKPRKDALSDQWAAGLSYATVMKACRAVKAWEQEFHRLRFAYPHHSRTLRRHELRRLRHGLYVWWRYACYFHDQADPVDNESQNVDSPDLRMSFMRQFSTSQLHELRDMWETIKSAVGREVCPSVAAVRRQSGNVLGWAEAARVGWGDPMENNQVLGTIMKLRPEDILHLLVNRHRFATKASIIQFARFRNPWIEDSVETFSDAIQWALWERERQLVAEYGPRALHRRWYFPPLGFFPRPWGGIVDYKKAETEQLRDAYSRDTGVGTRYWIDDHGGPRRYLARQVQTGRLVVSRSW